MGEDMEAWVQREAQEHRMARTVASVLEDVALEIAIQDQHHPSGYPATRDGVRLGLAAAEDELEESKRAWAADRCKCPTPECDHAEWEATREEVIDTVAVLLRTARSIEVSREAKADGKDPHA